MAALVSLFLLTGVPPFKLLGYQWDLGWVGVVLFAFYLVWLLNLYNFMDGIDGLASLEAIFVCVGGALVYWMNDKAAFSLPPVAGFCCSRFLVLELSSREDLHG